MTWNPELPPPFLILIVEDHNGSTTTHNLSLTIPTCSFRPDNLCLIIVGEVNHEEIFESLKDFDEKISSKGGLPPMTRPWTSKVPPLGESVHKIVEYGADDEDHGMVIVVVVVTVR